MTRYSARFPVWSVLLSVILPHVGPVFAAEPPCYRPYRLAYRLTNNGGKHQVFVGDITVNKWLPGSIELFTEEFFKEPADLPPGEVVEVSDSIRLPDDLVPGSYTLSVAVVGARTSEPVVQLGIVGRSKDGWYPLSAVMISQ